MVVDMVDTAVDTVDTVAVDTTAERDLLMPMLMPSPKLMLPLLPMPMPTLMLMPMPTTADTTVDTVDTMAIDGERGPLMLNPKPTMVVDTAMVDTAVDTVDTAVDTVDTDTAVDTVTMVNKF